ncbi:rod shape-determining protein MreC [Luteimonas aestuarii]|uniref:Cell shape-determining protein MreC n=1 Tax=Luteimonas aestuarii TaxID=453837 RepID=A0A4R5TTU7_9GAMM|nr:rod shape-determining protein MreC [Luteimonas aestuarii]TDK24430.1 rod shape-determining protein MreC [Luteimonas aestuarii]
MPAYASPNASRPGDVAGTLRLLAYLALAVTLIVLDHRGGWLSQARATMQVAVQPLWQLAGLPSRMGRSMRDDAATRGLLAEDNRRLRNELLVMGARQARLQVESEENTRLRGLLGAAERGGLDVQLAPILDIDLEPTRQRLLLDAGSRQGVRQGQSVIDAGGLLGQIIAVTPGTATVLLLTDLDHAVPVVVPRNGVRLVAYGVGRSDRLELRNIPVSADLEEGDVVVTSGLGGRFPPGFPVGTVTSLRPDDSHAFILGELMPAAQLDRGRDVLLLQENRAPITFDVEQAQAPPLDDAVQLEDAAAPDATPAQGPAP